MISLDLLLKLMDASAFRAFMMSPLVPLRKFLPSLYWAFICTMIGLTAALERHCYPPLLLLFYCLISTILE